MAFRAGSAEEMAAQSSLQLPEDEYLGVVSSMEFESAEGKPPTPYGPAQDQWKTKIQLLSFADGSDLEDIDGKPVEDFSLTVWLNVNKMGMVPQPSKARRFLTAILRIPVGAAIEIANFPEDVIGKQLYVTTVNKKTDSGTWTRADGFRPLKIERARRGAPATEEPAEEQIAVPAGSGIEEDEIQF